MDCDWVVAIISLFGGIGCAIVVYAGKWVIKHVDSKKIYDWMLNNSSDENGNRWYSTLVIGVETNLPNERVRYICTHHKNIFLSRKHDSSGDAKNEMWRVYGGPISEFEQRLEYILDEE